MAKGLRTPLGVAHWAYGMMVCSISVLLFIAIYTFFLLLYLYVYVFTYEIYTIYVIYFVDHLLYWLLLEQPLKASNASSFGIRGRG